MKQIRLTIENKKFREIVDGKTYEYELPSLFANVPDEQVNDFEEQLRAQRRAHEKRLRKQ